MSRITDIFIKYINFYASLKLEYLVSENLISWVSPIKFRQHPCSCQDVTVDQHKPYYRDPWRVWVMFPKKKQLTRHLALQGAFVEHQVALQELPIQKRIDVVLVRSPEDLTKCQALIIPGGGMLLIYVSLNPS